MKILIDSVVCLIDYEITLWNRSDSKRSKGVFLNALKSPVV